MSNSYFQNAGKKATLSEYVRRQKELEKEPEAKEDGKIPFEPFVAPKMDKKTFNAAKFQQTLAATGCLHPKDPISTHYIDRKKYLPEGYKGNVVVNPLLTFSIGGYNRISVEAIQASGADPGVVKAIMTKANESYYGNGSPQGLCTRIKKQLQKQPARPLTELEAKNIKRMLPIKQYVTLRNITDMSSVEMDVRVDAHAGAPWFIPGVELQDVLEEVLRRTQQYLLVLKEQGFEGMKAIMRDQKHQHEFVMLMSAKTEVYDRSEYLEKVRPFGVVPSSLKLIFMLIMSTIKTMSHNFLTHPECISAFGFSWANGGTEDLVAWLYKKQDKPYRFLTWGDDQLWVVMCKDGTVFVIAPDVSGMDMKIMSDTMHGFLFWILNAFGDVPDLKAMKDSKFIEEFLKHSGLDETWFNAAVLFVDYIRNHVVITLKQLTFQQTGGLLSGLPGTTQLDFIASVRLLTAIEQIPPPNTEKDIKAWSTQVLKVAAGVGFPLKSDTMRVQRLYTKEGVRSPAILTDDSWTPCQEGVHLALPFLGMTIKDFTPNSSAVVGSEELTFPVPVMDVEKGLTNVVFNVATSNKEGPEGKREIRDKQMSMLIGQGMFLFSDENAYKILHKAFEMTLATGARIGRDPHLETPGLEGFDYAMLEGLSQYPSPEWFAHIFASPAKQKMLVVSLQIDDSAVAAASQQDLEDDEDDFVALPPSRLKVVEEEDSMVAMPPKVSSSSSSPVVTVAKKWVPKQPSPQPTSHIPAPTTKSVPPPIPPRPLKTPLETKRVMEAILKTQAQEEFFDANDRKVDVTVAEAVKVRAAELAAASPAPAPTKIELPAPRIERLHSVTGAPPIVELRERKAFRMAARAAKRLNKKLASAQRRHAKYHELDESDQDEEEEEKMHQEELRLQHLINVEEDRVNAYREKWLEEHPDDDIEDDYFDESHDKEWARERGLEEFWDEDNLMNDTDLAIVGDR